MVFTGASQSAETGIEPEMAAEVFEQADYRAIDLYFVGLAGDDYSVSEIERFAPDYLVTAPSAAQLTRAFGDAANRIVNEVKGTYLTAYCETGEFGTQTLAIDVLGVGDFTAKSLDFDTTGRAPGTCNTAFLTSTRCAAKECGGFLCGACDDRSEGCGSDGMCKSYCDLEPLSQCTDPSYVNPAGYAQECFDEALSACESACFNLAEDPLNCGECGTRCSPLAASPACESGECLVAQARMIHTGNGGTTCGVLRDGTIKCWGVNNVGQVGNGTTRTFAEGAVTVPVKVTGISTAVQVDVGRNHACAVLSNGSVKCWGNGGVLLGDGTSTGSTTPVTVSGITNAKKVVSGNAHTCVLLTDRTVKCWGTNFNGEIGDGTKTFSTLPVAATGLTGVDDLDAGFNRTCAVAASNEIYCWGEGTTTPTKIDGLLAFSVAVGNSHTCAARGVGDVVCWGDNSKGQLGVGPDENGIVIASSAVPVTAKGLNGLFDLAAGFDHTCAVDRNPARNVYCWGSNDRGQLGDGTKVNRNVPVAIEVVTSTEFEGEFGVKSLSDTCAILSGGSFEAYGKCWGPNEMARYFNPFNFTGTPAKF